MSSTFDNIRIPVEGGRPALDRKVKRLAGTAETPAYHILRESIDARDHGKIRVVYTVATGPEPALTGVRGLLPDGAGFRLPATGENRPVVVGTGPAGMFAGLLLAFAGRRPILLEQGRPVEKRAADVAGFWSGEPLHPYSNVQFGEGGAGTFSDGKLTTGIRDHRVKAVFQELVLAGAPREILYLSKPHIGTDILPAVVRAIRKTIEALGGEYRFSSRFSDFHLTDGCISSIEIERMTGEDGSRTGVEDLPARHVVLAIGHSARDTQERLLSRQVILLPKPFSVGVRIEHTQAWIDRTQYGASAGHPGLPPAEYKLACHLPSGRSVYTFCMCPGGRVVAAASESGRVVTNGMSAYSRDGRYGNSALLVSVDPEDFPNTSPLGGVAFQRHIEETAFQAAGSGWLAPVQTVGRFLPDADPSSAGGAEVIPTYRPGTAEVGLERYLPEFVVEALRESLPLLDRKMHGFASSKAVMTGPETRSSSPVRIVRDHAGQSSVPGLFPCGEGAGYAGGIVSAAVDGLRAAEAVLREITGSNH